MTDAAKEPLGWVLYDESCGVCNRWVPFWENTLRRRGLEIAPLQSERFRGRLGGAEGDLLRDLLLLRPDGNLVRGADVYRFALRRIWWAYPLYLLSVAPGFRRLFDRAYRAFADRRHRISAACGLRGARPKSTVAPEAPEETPPP